MKAELRISDVTCPHCGKEAFERYARFTGDSEPYVEENQKETINCDHCKNQIRIDVDFSCSLEAIESPRVSNCCRKPAFVSFGQPACSDCGKFCELIDADSAQNTPTPCPE